MKYRNIITLAMVALSALPLVCAPPLAMASKPQGHWWQHAVFYEVFVRSFADSQKGPLANDGIGDLQGLIEKLDYLNDGDASTTHDLGVTALWLMPIMQSPSYHGYDVTDYYKVNQEYGSNDDFKRLIKEAHRRGINVIIDLVLNHASNSHPIFGSALSKDSEYRDWFVWEKKPKAMTGAYGNDAWHLIEDEYYYGFFSSSMPDWKLRNNNVTQELLKAIEFWVKDMEVDGFRLDAVRYLVEDSTGYADTEGTHAWLKNFHAHAKKLNPKIFTVGEVWAETATTASYGADELDTTFQFELAAELLRTANIGTTLKFSSVMDELLRRFQKHHFSTFLSNHDQTRVMTILGDAERAKLAATLLLTLPGVPFLYYGEEIGMSGRKPDPDLRTPMQWAATEHAGFSMYQPWAPVKSDYETINVAMQQTEPASLLNHYKTLIQLRTQHAALRTGEYRAITTSSKKILAYERFSQEERMVVIINLSGKAISEYALNFDAPKQAAHEMLRDETLVGGDSRYRVTGNKFKPFSELAPRSSYVILYQNKKGKRM